MCLTGGIGAKREMLATGGWDKVALIATPVSPLDKKSTIIGTYWLLQGAPRMLCISGRDLWPTCTDTTMSVILDLGDLSQYKFVDLSSTSTWVTSDTVMNRIKSVTRTVKREITPQQAGNFGAEPSSSGSTCCSKQKTACGSGSRCCRDQETHRRKD